VICVSRSTEATHSRLPGAARLWCHRMFTFLVSLLSASMGIAGGVYLSGVQACAKAALVLAKAALALALVPLYGLWLGEQFC
jgi:hypothetical protein